MENQVPFTLYHTIEAAAARAVKKVGRDDPALVAMIRLFVVEDVERWIATSHDNLAPTEGNEPSVTPEHARILNRVREIIQALEQAGDEDAAARLRDEMSGMVVTDKTVANLYGLASQIALALATKTKEN
jgi:hypothetical protein